MPNPIESERRRPGAHGTPIRLADGQVWLLAAPVFRVGHEGLTRPAVDRALDRIFETLTLDGLVSLEDAWAAARALLLRNYRLDDDEAAQLLSVSPGAESQTLVDAVLAALLGSGDVERTYSSWVRASLLANGLAQAEIPSADLPNVLAILLATGRTVPVDQFIDACRAARDDAALESQV
jgi:hypothetical protein